MITASLGGLSELDELLPIIQEKVYGVMCGQSNFGLFSADAFALTLIHSLTTSFHSIGYSDGMVPLDSCKAAVPGSQLSKFSLSYKSKHYLARINHSDGRCVRNDGWWGVDRKPCLWYAHQGLEEKQYVPAAPIKVSSGSALRPGIWPF